jgi:hypothetical protein
MEHNFKDYLEARLPGIKKQVGYWYPATHEINEVPGNYYGTLIVPRKYMKNLALPDFGFSEFGVHTITDGQIFLITNGAHELYFMQVARFDSLRINRDGEFVFHDVVAVEPDNLDVLNAIHLAKVLQRR